MAKSRIEKTRAERAGDLLSFYTKKELADSMGVSQSTVRNWIKGKSQPSDKNFKKISRREYYWTSGEREKTVKGTGLTKGQNIEEYSGLQIFDLIRSLENGSIGTQITKGHRYLTFQIDTIHEGELTETSSSFSNPGKGEADPNDMVGFLYRIFRNAKDRFSTSELSVNIASVEV